MKNYRDHSEETRIANATFEAFVSDELLPQVGISRKAFDSLLDQLVNTVRDSLPLNGHPGAIQPVTSGQKGIKWGSLFNALYQEDAIPHCAGLRAGQKTNPARTRRVTSSTKDFLDIAFPLTDGSHHDVTSYMVYFQNLMMILADGSTAGLQNPAQFVAKTGPCDSPESILLLQNGLHVELAFDARGKIGAGDLAGINDVQVEIVKSSRSDVEAKSVDGKIDRYRELMSVAFSKRKVSADSEPEPALANSESTQFTSKSGEQYVVSNSGHIVYVNATNAIDGNLVNDEASQPLAISLVDTLIVSLIASSANRMRNADSFDTGPRIIVVSDNTALTLQMLHCADKACRQSRITPQPRSQVTESCETVCQIIATEKNTAADIRAEREPLNDPGQRVTQKHSPVNNNEKVTNAETSSINKAVLTAMHHHGFELARLSKGLPGDSFGEQNQLQSGTFA